MDGQSKVLRLILLLLRFHCIVLNVLGANDFFAIIGTETLQSTVHRLQDLQGCSAIYTSHPLHNLGKWQTANNECDVPWKLNWDEIFHINTYFHQDAFLTWCRRKSLYLEVMAVCNSPTTCSWGHQFYICFQSTKWCSFQLKLRNFPLKHILMPIWFGKAAFKTFNYANLLTDWLFKKFSGNYHLEFSLCIF